MNVVAATAAAHLAPLDHAPAVTTFAALLVQLLPAAVLLTSPAPLWRRPAARAAGLAALLLTSLSGSIWLNTISSQFHLCAAVFLVAIEEAAEGSTVRRRLLLGLLLVAGLTGPPSCFLAPVFAFRAIRAAGPARKAALAQAVVLGACCVVQGIVFLAASAPGGAPSPDRLAGFDPALLGAVALVETVALPFGGIANANRLSTLIERVGGPDTAAFTVLGWGALIVLAAVLASQRGIRGRIAACYGVVVVPSIALSAGTGMTAGKGALLTPMFAERYFYAPSFMLVVLAIAFAAADGVARSRRVVAGALAVSAILFGTLDFRATLAPYVSGKWPAWRDEVAAWRADPERPVRAWPPTFAVRLPASAPR